MARYTLHILSVILFVFALLFTGRAPAQSDSSQEPADRAFAASSYRSRSASHKVIVYAEDHETRERILAEGGSVVEDYGAFTLFNVSTGTAASISAQSKAGAEVRDDLNVIFLRAGAFDTSEGEPAHLNFLGDGPLDGERLYLVQMAGPVKREWLDELGDAVEIINYVPNNAYLVRADADGRDRLNSLSASAGGFIQWSGDFKPVYKIAPEISLNSDREITVTVQFVNSDRADAEIHRLASDTSAMIVGEPVSVLKYTNARMVARTSELADIARSNDVVWIEEWKEPELHDEKQNLIIAGKYTGNQLDPPGYMAWLESKGLGAAPDFIVDISDSGIDRGLLDPEMLHEDFLNSAGVARIAYARYMDASGEDDLPTHDTTGHGTINASIVGGYNIKQGFPYVDSDGYSFGLGVHPFARLGVTKIFAPDYTNPNLISMVELMHGRGTRISSNSWGAKNNSYTIESQIYDALVRDARPGEFGNQEITVIFSSGNSGAGSLSVPGNAKNVIAVGASENLRPVGTDGCNVTGAGADDINSIINFSSGGPATDGRVKPDIVAPGTHIQGAQPQGPAFDASGVCGPRNFPGGQTLYTWSSGTSHSAPAVAGAAAIIRQFFQSSTGRAPSPAMVKAFLTNSTNYMTGVRAGDNLPGNSQGWGLLNLGRALDDVPRLSVDQTQALSNSGQEFILRGFVPDSTKPFRVTLAWTDAPGTPFANPVVNDLDLRVEIDGKTYLGNKFAGSVSVEGGSADKLNNIESVWLPEGVTGEFVIRVVAANITGDGLPGNGDTSDQDFALVVYNARPQDDDGGGGGGGEPVDSPPTVNLTFPVGGERIMVGDLIRIIWNASDDKAIQSQRIDFSADNGVSFSTIAVLDGNARNFDWRVPSFPTPFGRIKVTALDGVNLPVASVSPNAFEIVNGPPDTAAPQVLLLSPSNSDILGGGLVTSIKWTESDNVGVIQRVIELSTDNGETFQRIISLTAPGSGEQRSYDWQVPAVLSADKAKVRITVYDGAGNSATITSAGKFQVWPLPIITEAVYSLKNDGRGRLELSGRNFRKEMKIFIDGKKLKKLNFDDKCDGSGACKKVTSVDKKIHKRVPEGKFVTITVQFPTTGQVSPEFTFKRKKSKQT